MRTRALSLPATRPGMRSQGGGWGGRGVEHLGLQTGEKCRVLRQLSTVVKVRIPSVLAVVRSITG